MAARKKAAAKTKTPARGRTAAKASASKVVPLRRRGTKHSNEIIAIAAIAAGILIAVSVYAGAGGVAGQALNGVFKGLFGFGAFVAPVAVAGAGLAALLNKQNGFGYSKAMMAFGLFLCVLIFIHVFTKEQDIGYDGFLMYLAGTFEKGSAANGGVFGAVFGDLLLKTLGDAGTYILIFATAMVLIILLTDKSIFTFVKSLIEKLREYSESRAVAREEYEYDDEPEAETAVEKAVPLKSKKANTVTFPERRPPKSKATLTIEKKPAQEEAKKILMFNDNGKIKPAPILREIGKGRITEVITLDGKRELERERALSGEAMELMSRRQEQAQRAAVPVTLKEKQNIYEEPYTEQVYEAEADTGIPDGKPEGLPEPNEPPYDDYGYVPEKDGDVYELPEYAGPYPDEVYISTSSELSKLMDAEIAGEADEAVAAGFGIGQGQKQPPKAAVQDSGIREFVHLPYSFPPLDLLNKTPFTGSTDSRKQILDNSRKLEETLKSFGVEAKVIEVSKGPTVTRYELSPGQGVKVSKISGLADDLALNLAAAGIRIEAPIPGKAAVGIEVPNKEVTPVYLREVIGDDAFKNFPSRLAFALGKDIAGNTVVADIAKMPHMLIAGATGSGKSVCINTLVTSIIYKADPNEVKLVMVDPKVVELSVYNGIPHLLIPVVTDPKKAAGALNWAVQEMITRYNLFAETSVRDLKNYNALLTERGETALPQIVIIIDELADLMMAAPGEVEDAICRLAQMARAAGLHLIIATQRPSVDVITGLIKANIPSRLAFSVSSGTDSRTILDSVGAEKLLGKGDMLFYPVGMSKPQRVQGAFISDKEVESIVSFVKQNGTQKYDQEIIDKITMRKPSAEASDEVDDLFVYAAEFVIEKDKASASMLQRQFRIGYNRASRLLEELENRGVVGPEDGSKPRKVLMSSAQWEDYKENYL